MLFSGDLMISIREARSAELDNARTFIRRIFPDAMVAVAEDDTLLLAEEDGHLVGFAHVIYDEDRVLLQGIGVHESARGNGVGTMLLEYVLDMLRDTDLPIYLKVKPLNTAIDLYSRYGFFLKKFDDVHVLVKMANS